MISIIYFFSLTQIIIDLRNWCSYSNENIILKGLRILIYEYTNIEEEQC